MTTAILETTAVRPQPSKGSHRPRRSKSRRSQSSGQSDLKNFDISATLLGGGDVKVFFGQVGLTVTSRNEAEVEALLEGTLAGRRINAMFAALTAA